ncbi:hypothetical protein [Thalassiella azotivora]
MPARRGRWAAGAALAVAATALTACGGDEPGGADTEIVVPPGVTVELVQYRRDEAERRLAVKVRNGGDEPVRVTSVELSAEAVTGSGAVRVDDVVAPGGAVDLRVAYGDVRCDADVGAPVVRVGFDGREPVRVGPVTGEEVLERVVRRECAEDDVARAAELSWLPWDGGGGPDGLTDGVLRVHVRGERPVTVSEIQGTTLFTVVAAGTPVTAGPGQTLDVPVQVVPARCDPHAVGESKRGYHFGVRVHVGEPPDETSGEGASGTLVPVVPDEIGRAVLESILLVHCGLD